LIDSRPLSANACAREVVPRGNPALRRPAAAHFGSSEIFAAPLTLAAHSGI